MVDLAERRGSPYEYLALAMQSYTYKKETVDAYRHTPKWKEFLKRLKPYVAEGRVRLGRITVETNELLPSYPASEIEPGDVIEAKLAGLTFKKNKDNQGKDVYVLVGAVRRRTITLPVKPRDPSEPRDRSESPDEQEREVLQLPPNTEDEPRDEDPDAIPDRIISRSIVQMMYCLSLGVKVPPIHEREGIKLPKQFPILDFVVDVARHAPPSSDAFVSVKYRGHCFYIKRTYKAKDTEEDKASIKASKKFFLVLTELFVERAGKAATTPTILPL